MPFSNTGPNFNIRVSAATFVLEYIDALLNYGWVKGYPYSVNVTEKERSKIKTGSSERQLKTMHGNTEFNFFFDSSLDLSLINH